MVENKNGDTTGTYENGEIDDGAYSIIKGKERYIPMHRKTDSRALVSYQKKDKNLTCMAIRSGTMRGKTQSTRVNFVPEESLTFTYWRSGGPKAPADVLSRLGVHPPELHEFSGRVLLRIFVDALGREQSGGGGTGEHRDHRDAVPGHGRGEKARGPRGVSQDAEVHVEDRVLHRERQRDIADGGERGGGADDRVHARFSLP